jgi:hypothetical protein
LKSKELVALIRIKIFEERPVDQVGGVEGGGSLNDSLEEARRRDREEMAGREEMERKRGSRSGSGGE